MDFKSPSSISQCYQDIQKYKDKIIELHKKISDLQIDDTDKYYNNITWLSDLIKKCHHQLDSLNKRIYALREYKFINQQGFTLSYTFNDYVDDDDN